MMNRDIARRSLLLAAGGATVAGSAAKTALAASPSNLGQETRNFADSRLSTKYRFDDPDMDLFFVVSLGWGAAGGLSVGEGFYVASTIVDGDADSWVSAFQASGDRQLQQAEEWAAAGATRQAAQARLKAFASYRSAWQFAPIGPVFEGLYAKHKAAFRHALLGLGLSATFFNVPHAGGALPGVFVQNPDPQAPVVLLLGGADTCFEEIFLTTGRHLLDSGYSVAMADLPGQGITQKDGLHWEAEPEKPIAKIVDLLIERFGARSGRMALLGYSLGGYWATRAAGYENRFATVIASTPMPRPGDFFRASLAAKAKQSALGGKPSIAATRNLQIILWKAGVANAAALPALGDGMVADPKRVTMPFLSIAGAGEGAEFLHQTQTWHDQIQSSRKKVVILDASTGGDGHCQAANRLRLAQEMCVWMDPIFRT